MSMSINAKKGDKVKYANPRNGKPIDQQTAKKYLVLDREYTIVSVHAGDSRTEVYLHGLPHVSFNSVMFDDVSKN